MVQNHYNTAIYLVQGKNSSSGIISLITCVVEYYNINYAKVNSNIATTQVFCPNLIGKNSFREIQVRFLFRIQLTLIVRDYAINRTKIMKQTITYKTAALGLVDVIVQANPYYRNTFTIGDKRVCFDNIVPGNVDLRKENFDLLIYDGVNVHCILSYGNKDKKTIEFELLTVYTKTEGIYPSKLL